MRKENLLFQVWKKEICIVLFILLDTTWPSPKGLKADKSNLNFIYHISPSPPPTFFPPFQTLQSHSTLPSHSYSTLSILDTAIPLRHPIPIPLSIPDTAIPLHPFQTLLFHSTHSRHCYFTQEIPSQFQLIVSLISVSAHFSVSTLFSFSAHAVTCQQSPLLCPYACLISYFNSIHVHTLFHI